jgi:hypothetical protein
VLDITQTDISVEGNTSVWGTESISNRHYMAPQPDVRATMGTNKPTEFTSGQSWAVLVRGAPEKDTPSWAPANYVWADENVENKDYDAEFFNQNEFMRVKRQPSNTRAFAWFIQQDDTVNVVWTASSGGKTQTLFKYTVQ